MAAPKTLQAQLLSGIAEADETFFLKSAKGQRKGLSRAPHKRGGKTTKRGTSREHVPVLIARDRAGATANIALDATTAKDMDAALRPIRPDDTVLCTDGSSALATAARRLGVEHHAVDLSAGVRVNGARHLQKGSAFAPDSWLAAPLQRRGDPLPRELPRLVPRARPVARIYSGTRVAPRIGGQGMSASSANWK